MAVCLLVRHGHSQANAQGVLAGWAPGVALTEKGTAQAAAVAAALAGVDVVRLVSSPLQRCLETATPIAETRGQDVETVEALGECHYGAWTGRALKDLAAEPLWRVVQDDPGAATFPGSAAYRGESLTHMTRRVTGALERIDDEVTSVHGPDAVWVAVSHGDPIKAVLAQVAGAGVSGLQRFHVDPGSISVVHRWGPRAMVLGTNRSDSQIEALTKVAAGAHLGAAGDAAVGGGGGDRSASPD